MLAGAPMAVLDVYAAAEDHVLAALRRLHFTIVKRANRITSPHVVEAWTGSYHVFMHVSAAVDPDQPPVLTPEERRTLQQRARSAGGEAWGAKVVLQPDRQLAWLDWRPLEERAPGE